MSNEEMAAQWASGSKGWVAHEERFDLLYRAVTDAILAAAAIGPTDRVLDIGCGTGTLLRAAADLGAEVVGIDLAPAMTDAAAQRVPQATLITDDAQTLDLRTAVGEPGFSTLVSRFGVMFFDDPTAAFTRLRAAAAADGRLVFACWRTLAENPTFTLGTEVLLELLPAAAPAAVGAPGPTSLAEPDRISEILNAAGWADVMLEPLDFVCDYGSGEAGVEERLAIVLATTSGQKARSVLLPVLGESGWAELLDQVRERIRSSLVDGRVQHPGATWLVRARA